MAAGRSDDEKDLLEVCVLLQHPVPLAIQESMLSATAFFSAVNP